MFNWFAKKYIENPSIRNYYWSWTHFILPIFYSVILAVAATKNFQFLWWMAGFLIVVVVYVFNSLHILILNQRIPDSKLERKVAQLNGENELLGNQIKKYVTIQSILEVIRVRDIRKINEILQEPRFEKEQLFALFDAESQIKFIIRQISDQLNALNNKKGNFRVTFMEIHNNKLHLKFWSDWPGKSPEIPTMKAMDIQLMIKQGCAGKAWNEFRIIYLPSIEQDYKTTKIYTLWDPSKLPRAKSMVSIPLIDKNSQPWEVVGVLNIDTTIKGYFEKPEDNDDELEHSDIEDVNPFIQRLVLHKKICELYNFLKSLSVIKLEK